MSHTCNYCVVTCIDFRFHPLLQSFFYELGECDRVALAGASKAIVDEDIRDVVLKQINISQKLHNVTSVILVDHEDCGAYGGKKAVTSDKSEINLHAQTLHQARDIIQKHLPGLTIELKFVKLNGEIIDL